MRALVIFLVLVATMVTLHVIVHWGNIAPELIRKIHGG